MSQHTDLLVDLAKVDPIMRHFSYEHLPPRLQEISRPFCHLAVSLVHGEVHLPRDPERTVALRKLLEAKDAAVRACVDPLLKSEQAGKVAP